MLAVATSLSVLLSLPLAASQAPKAPTLEELSTPPAAAQRLPAGLVTQVLREGTGAKHPKVYQRVQARFRGYRLDGSMFMDSFEEETAPVFELGKVFEGWRKGLLLMVEGEVRRLWIPPGLGSPKETETVVFDIELEWIDQGPKPPPDLREPPEDAETLPSGVRTRVIEPGTGKEHPGPGDGALVGYTGWTSDGSVFDATASRGRPTMFLLGKVLPAFAECLEKMVVEETRRCWIPKRLARGQWVNSPQGDLVFDIRLLRIVDTE